MPIRYEKPEIDDGASMWALARESGSLDLNSPYYYLTFSREFSDTSIVAKSDNHVVGFICGFRPARSPEALFVWQIAVADSHRRQGVAQQMLRALMERLARRGVSFLEATVTPSNTASQRMFRSFAEKHGAAVNESPYFAAEVFPEGGHEEERLLRMGPFGAASLQQTERETAARGSS